MKFPIGFQSSEKQPRLDTSAATPDVTVKESVALVDFPGCRIPLQYYNDRFDLKPGDIVFVEGKYEGVPGRVQKVSTSFKIKIEDYKKVLSVADTKVRGTFQQANMHLIAFDRSTLPYRQAKSWFKAVDDAEEYFVRFDGDAFSLDTVGMWPFSKEIMDRGFDYYRSNKVVYLCLDGEMGKAIVAGTKAYEVRFQYKDGQISGLTCDCPCGYNCKHGAVVLFQLSETLKCIAEKYESEYNESGYFAVVDKVSFLSFAITNNEGAILELR